jgi:pilus assembly protein CpaF
MERDIKSFRNDIMKAKNKSLEGLSLNFDEAFEEIKQYIEDKKTEELSKDYFDKSEIIKKDKEYLRKRKKEYRELIREAMGMKNIAVRGYKRDDFIEKVLSELVGYSILDDAFYDPEITDIYVIDWKTIFVEKKGVNQRYHKTFNSPEHYEVIIKKFIDEAGKEINLGEGKIVDFELYQDRGAGTSPGVSPRDYTLTIRKHEEEHITLENLLDWGLMNKKVSDLIGMLITGETNLVCAGLTGSGKTTTIRAFLDYFVTKSNKRMLVCEDTQELFPKNEHTVELVTVKHEDKKMAVTLRDLIITSLRLKPKYIVVGEVRGVEAEAAVEAMETGHSTIFTIHGGTTTNVINRIATKYLMQMPSLSIDIVERIVGSALDYVFVQDNIPGIGRKITSLTEISYDFDERRVKMRPIFEFNFATKEWDFKNHLDDSKINKMLRRGISIEKLKPWMSEELKSKMNLV